MQKYKITASKSQKKYTFVLSAENEKLAKQRVHKDGYSILWVELFDESKITRNTFIFEATKNWEKKSWKVVWDDLFKVYLKLIQWVWYDVLKLYFENDKDESDEYKENILKDLKEQYAYYQKNNKNYKDNKISEKKNVKLWKNEVNIDNFYLKKQLEDTYKLIDFVLLKLSKLIENKKYNLDVDRKDKFRKLYTNLVKTKSSTNISKLKEIWEIVLLKIWKIELESLEKFKDEESKKYLLETNKLLRKIGSWKKFIPEDRDIKKQFEKILNKIKSFLISLSSKKWNKKNNNEDKVSHYYIKNRIFLNKYKQKLLQNNIELLKNIYIFLLPIAKYDDKRQSILVRRSIIKQNIYLFKAKLDWKTFSYSKTLKWFNYILNLIFKFFNYIKDYLFFVVLFYSLFFLIFLNLTFYNIFPKLELNLNYNGIFYFIMFIFVYFSIYFSRGVYSLIFNFIMLFFIFWFWIINF